MAFIENDFSPMGASARAGVVPQHFSYTSPDTLSTIKTSGYFDAISELLSKDDWIHTVAVNGGTEVYTIIFVAAITAGVVTIVTVDISAA